ncbi:hypothetical protein [Acinetobacter seifertii]|uniref:hypothetical protein n=1 Tax=Acinetobacter seifertii TaxID=1530123 RepID=UPI001F070A79|nr:hypothetical protein [Acinetobacter seifertii]MCH2000372.1 hypothetical protein [Acinetobacter seifertii]
MPNTELKGKIKIVGFWTFGGIFWYLVISFFLLSNYPLHNFSFNNQKAYEVLKDALSLAAAFLAPVAAFVLFDDWRTSHRLKINESEAIEILKRVRNIPYKTKDLAEEIVSYYERGLTKQEIQNYEKRAFEIAAEILEELGSINFSKKNFENIKFHDQCLKLYSDTYNFLTNIIMLFDAWTCLELCKNDTNRHDQLPSLIAREDISRTIFFQSAEKFLELFDNNLNEIENLADEHRIR